MLKLYIRSCRSITHFVYPPPPHVHITSQGCLIVCLQILDIRSCMQVFFPCFLPQKKTYDVYQNIYWIIYWNQISGLVTHQAHHAQGCLSSKYWKPIMIFNVEISYQVLQHITQMAIMYKNRLLCIITNYVNEPWHIHRLVGRCPPPWAGCSSQTPSPELVCKS